MGNRSSVGSANIARTLKAGPVGAITIANSCFREWARLHIDSALAKVQHMNLKGSVLPRSDA